MIIYVIDLDEMLEELFHEMEKVQDGNMSHKVEFNGTDFEDAYLNMMLKLKPFFQREMVQK